MGKSAEQKAAAVEKMLDAGTVNNPSSSAGHVMPSKVVKPGAVVAEVHIIVKANGEVGVGGLVPSDSNVWKLLKHALNCLIHDTKVAGKIQTNGQIAPGALQSIIGRG